LYLSRTLDERISIIEQYLLDCFRPVSFDDLKLIKEGLNLINQSKGQIDISSLSRDLCLTEKSLLRKFSSIIGKAPKQYSRIVRFQQIIRSLSVYGSRNLTQIAIDNGYFDQAHFIRDFKALSGYTPKEFLLHYPCNSDDSNP
jgi:AraC-like DNA-binding protein